MQSPLTLVGTYGSPYSLKMRAVLRYRQIPFKWVIQGTKDERALPRPNVALIPAIGFPDEHGAVTKLIVDSTPLIARLEKLHTPRSLTPADPVVAFLSLLIEDYADEWLTKPMYHYRWYFEESVERAKRMLPYWPGLHLTDAQLKQFGDSFAERQIGRRALVGSTEANAPIIESSYVRLLQLLDAHIENHDFLLGRRPGNADFGLFGQLSQLVCVEPPSTRLCFEHGPRVYSWTNRVDDLSWWPVDGDDGWYDRTDLPMDTLGSLLEEIGATYVPFMLANKEALDTASETVSCQIRGAEYRQGAFKYQGVTIGWIRDAYNALGDDERASVNGLLAGTGCEQLFI